MMKPVSLLTRMIGIIALATLVGMIPAHSQTTSAAFLRMTIGSRAQAMGDAFTGLAENATGMYYNPAGMGFGQNRELMIFHAQWLEDISVENLTFMYPVTSRFSFGAGFSYLHFPQLTRFELDPSGGAVENGKFSVYDVVATAGMGYRLTESFSVGANIKFFQEQLESVTASSYAADFGLLWKLPVSDLNIGIAVQNVGPEITYTQAKEQLPRTYRVGLAYQMPNNDATFALDMVKTGNDEWRIFPGIEIGFMNSFYLRGGYQLAQNETGNVSGGFGIKVHEKYEVNYVYAPFGDLGATHRAELIFSFGSPSASIYHASRSEKIRDAAEEQINMEERPAAQEFAKPRRRQELKWIPQHVKVSRMEHHKFLLSWQPLPGSDVRYNVYVKVPGKKKWIRITREPIFQTFKIFNPKNTAFRFLFAITSVRKGVESDFSDAIYFEQP